MSNRVTIDIVAASGEVNKALGQITGALAAFKSRVDVMATKAAIGFAAVGGGLALAVREAMGAEDAWAKVDAALVATNQNVELWGANLRDVAAEIQKNTVYGDEFTAGLLAQSIAMGVAADKAGKLAKDAMALSATTGGALSPETAQRGLIEATEESYRKLQMYIPALKGATTEQQRQAIIADQVGRGYALLAAQAQTLGGVLARLRNAFSDIAENLGNALLPSLKGIAEWLTRVVPKIHDFVTANANTIASVAGWVAGGLGLLAVLPRILGGLVAMGQGAIWLNTIITGMATGSLSLTSKLGAMLLSVHPLTVAIVALGGVLAYLGYQFIKAKIEAAMYADQLARIKAASEALKAAEDARAKATTPEGRLALAREELAALEKLIAEGQALRGESIERRNNLSFIHTKDWAPVEEEITALSRGIATLIRKRDAVQAVIDANQKLVDAEREAGNVTKATTDAYDKRLAQLQLEARLIGTKADQAERLKAIEAGATAAEADRLAAQVRKNEALKEQLEVTEAIAELNRQAWRAELESGGIDPDGAGKLFELALRGATPEQLDEARAAMERIAAAKAQAAAAEKTAGQQLAESLKTEEQITREKLAQLDASLARGEIDAKTHREAMDALQEQIAAFKAANFGESVTSMYDRIARSRAASSAAAIEIEGMRRNGGVPVSDPVVTGIGRDMGILRQVAEWLRTSLPGLMPDGFGRYGR